MTFDANWQGPPELKPRVYRTQSEKDTFFAVAVENEYKCPPLQPDDVVIDIGAHIGSFSHLARRLGSKNIYAFELESSHIEAALENLKEGLGENQGGLMGNDPDIVLYHCAVVRGDAARAPQYYANNSWNAFGVVGEPVESLSLDQILGPHERVRFLKMDCEGGEWPILSTSLQLHKVQEIAGEYHILDNSAPELENLPITISREGLGTFLTEHGYDVEFSGAETIGGFHAWRHGAKPVRRKELASQLRRIASELETI